MIERKEVRSTIKALRDKKPVWYAADQDYGRKHRNSIYGHIGVLKHVRKVRQVFINIKPEEQTKAALNLKQNATKLITIGL